jgi:two-component system, LytTR family, sensor histidine kinase AlgZ
MAGRTVAVGATKIPFGMFADSVLRTSLAAAPVVMFRTADSSANLTPTRRRMDSETGVPSDVLPDFRSTGVIGRVLVIVNVAVLFAVAVTSQTDAELVPMALAKAAIVEPILFASLIALYIGNAKLAPLRYEFAVVLITLFVMLVTAFVFGLVSTFDAGASRFGFARALAFAALGVLFMLEYFRMRSRALSPALVEARLQALQARIRPHFLFNSINAVLSLIRTDPRRAEAVIEDLADLFRTLMADSRQLVTLEDEIRLVRGYLDIEQLRLGDRLVIHWRIDGAPKHALVPPLFLQPLVENAVYHGVEPGKGPGIIEIDIVRRDDRLAMRLANPYHPQHQHRQGNRIALANIKERLALHFDAEATLTSGTVGDRYEIHVDLPYRRSRKEVKEG